MSTDVVGSPPAATVQRQSEGRWATLAFLRLIEWFLPPAYTDLPHIRQHTLVFIGSIMASGPVLLCLGLVAFLVVPPDFALLPWAVLCTTVFAFFPFLIKWLGRVDLVAATVIQLISLVVFALAYFYGGLVSPALPWLLIAFIANFYWLEPWPNWRNGNLILFATELIVFVFCELHFGPAKQTVSDRSLLIMLFCSSTAVFAFTQLVLLLVWSMNSAKQRSLRREVAMRRTIEAELRIGREHLAQAQAFGRIGSAEYDLTTGQTTWSSEHYRLLALMPNTPGAVTDLLLAAVHPEDRGRVAAILHREHNGEVSPATEFRVVRPDGEVRWLLRQPEFIHGFNGEAIRIFATVQDITDWKDAAEDRTSLERQLFQSQKLEAIGKLAGSVAHDFNNLLSVVLGNLDLAMQELTTERSEVKGWVHSAVSAAERGKTLTNMMLTFAQRQPLQPEEIDPATVVRGFAEMLHRMLGETVEIKLISAPDQWHCEVDPGQLQSALLNLAVNARDAMPTGGTLTVATDNVHLDAAAAASIPGAQPGDYVLLTVSDTGIGMEPSVIDHAFEPFFTTKGSSQNTGLGLSMVSGFVTQSGGYINLFSVVGRGTTVVIYLPRKLSRAESVAGAAPRLEKAKADNVTILLVEDNEEVREITALQLKKLGYSVVLAANGAEALRQLSAHPEIGLLLSDIVLPGGMDGVEVARRATETRSDLRVIFMSGYSAHTTLPAFGATGTPRLLRKPFHNRELAEEISATLADI
ncbi:MAG TPA: ATP-binding protein [Magnetospirillaceae bacterium]